MARDGGIKQRQHFFHYGDTICHPRSGYVTTKLPGASTFVFKLPFLPKGPCKFKKNLKDFGRGGWVKCPIGYKQKLENIFLCIISFGFGEHLKVYNVINAPICLDCLL